MMKSWIDKVRMTVDQARYDVEAHPIPAEWSAWSKTFLFMPKRDIRGKYIVGPAYMRIVKNARHDVTDGDIVWVYYSDIVEFSRNKKDIFMRELNGTAKD